MAWLYILILIALAAALWGVYRVLGTPSRLTQVDYVIVLQDLVSSVERAAGRLRAALDAEPTGGLEDAAVETRKIFQTGYYQTLRLRPASGPDAAGPARDELGQACEAYDWASRMLGSESVKNPMVLDAARRLLDAGDLSLQGAGRELRALPVPPGSSERSPPAPPPTR